MRRFLNKCTGTVIQRIVTFEMKATRILHYTHFNTWIARMYVWLILTNILLAESCKFTIEKLFCFFAIGSEAILLFHEHFYPYRQSCYRSSLMRHLEINPQKLPRDTYQPSKPREIRHYDWRSWGLIEGSRQNILHMHYLHMFRLKILV